MKSWALGVLVVALAAASGWGAERKSPHPLFKDGGVLSWSTRAADAQRAARGSDRLILIEYGREA
jgi:hypothetical protein